MRFLIGFLAMLLISVKGNTLEVVPKFQSVELKEFTSLNLEIVPHLGTQLVFPFKLGNPDLDPPLKIRLSSSNGFKVPHAKDDLQTYVLDQNTISIIGLPYEGEVQGEHPIYLGNLFITVGGYNLSIALKTTYSTSKHVSNIVFELSDTDRNHLIERAVKRRLADLEKRHQEKLDGLGDRAKQESLVHIAAMATKKETEVRFKEEEDMTIGDARLTAYIDRVVSYGNEYHVLLFELENPSSYDYQIGAIRVSVVDGSNESPVRGALDCKELLEADSVIRCSLATTDSALLTSKKAKFRIETDRGAGEFSW